MTTINDIMKRKLTLGSGKETPDVQSIAEGLGIVIGVAVATSIAVLAAAWVVHFILGMVSIGNLTYWQIVGLLAIWELIKPACPPK